MKKTLLITLALAPLALHAQERAASTPYPQSDAVPLNCAANQVVTSVNGSLLCVTNNGGSTSGRYVQSVTSSAKLLDTRYGCFVRSAPPPDDLLARMPKNSSGDYTGNISDFPVTGRDSLGNCTY